MMIKVSVYFNVCVCVCVSNYRIYCDGCWRLFELVTTMKRRRDVTQLKFFSLLFTI